MFGINCSGKAFSPNHQNRPYLPVYVGCCSRGGNLAICVGFADVYGWKKGVSMRKQMRKLVI